MLVDQTKEHIMQNLGPTHPNQINIQPVGLDLAPRIPLKLGGTAFGGPQGSNSHFTHDDNGYHVSTVISGLHQGCEIKDKLDLKPLDY